MVIQVQYNLLFENNLNLIYYMINSVCKERNINDNYIKDDLVSIGAIGLSKAINKFDRDRIGEVSFSTFASLAV